MFSIKLSRTFVECPSILELTRGFIEILDFWIGGNDIENEGTFEWTDGSPGRMCQILSQYPSFEQQTIFVKK